MAEPLPEYPVPALISQGPRDDRPHDDERLARVMMHNAVSKVMLNFRHMEGVVRLDGGCRYAYDTLE